jgi:hypothetical protein
MDARTSELRKTYGETVDTGQMPTPVKASIPAGKVPTAKTARMTSQKRSRNRRKGREVVKSGMAASLAVSMMTGMKILRPMSLHPVASWVFVGLTVVHMLMYETPAKK